MAVVRTALLYRYGKESRMTDEAYSMPDIEDIDEPQACPEAVTLTVPSDEVGERLDRFITQHTEHSRSAAARLIDEGKITVDGAARAKNYCLREGQTVTLAPEDAPVPCEAVAENIPLSIVYEDADLLVINKPTGMVVHPAPGHAHGTLVNALLYHCGGELSGVGGVLRPGIVHRIDKYTGGLLVVAKNDRTHRALAAQLQGHHIEREYHALVHGGFRTPCGTVDAPIGRHPTDRKRMAVLRNDPHARAAVTHYEVLESFGPISYLKLNLQTGRTHQIRVHMSSIGHPLLGDTVYGGGGTLFERKHEAYLKGQALFARKLSFTHPTTGEAVSFSCELDEDMKKLLEILRAQA